VRRGSAREVVEGKGATDIGDAAGQIGGGRQTPERRCRRWEFLGGGVNDVGVLAVLVDQQAGDGAGGQLVEGTEDGGRNALWGLAKVKGPNSLISLLGAPAEGGDGVVKLLPRGELSLSAFFHASPLRLRAAAFSLRCRRRDIGATSSRVGGRWGMSRARGDDLVVAEGEGVGKNRRRRGGSGVDDLLVSREPRRGVRVKSGAVARRPWYLATRASNFGRGLVDLLGALCS
jgi:hypothetical protein